MNATKNPTALIVFSGATLAAIKLALAARQGTRSQRDADYSAYANARAAARAAKSFLVAGDR